LHRGSSVTLNRPLCCLLTGAAGFIGSHLADRLLGLGCRVIGIDNLRLGRRENLCGALESPEFTLIESDVNDLAGNRARLGPLHASRPIEIVWHLAANSDIPAGVEDPLVDLTHTLLTTVNSLTLARDLGIRRFAFASSSAVYGCHPDPLTEEGGPFRPISNYGAMKLASEGLISAALETHLEQAWVFRFPNVVGSRATHGVILDFVKRLGSDPRELAVLGNGTQCKPYLHVEELVSAMVHGVSQMAGRWNCCNIGPDGSDTTVARIAEAVVGRVAPGARIRYGATAQGWPGDVPRFRYSVERLRALGWVARLSSDEAVARAVDEVAREVLG